MENQLEKMRLCPKCQKEINEEKEACPFCGEVMPPRETHHHEESECSCHENHHEEGECSCHEYHHEGSKEKKGLLCRIPKAWMASVLAVLAFLALLILALAMKKAPTSYGLYLRDGELYYSSFSGKSRRITEKLGSEEYSLREISISPDGKNAVYLDHLEEDGSRDLYFRSLHPWEDAVKLDDNVSLFYVSADYKMLVYLKDNTLYQHDLTERKMVAGDVDGFYFSRESKVLLWRNEENEYYVKSPDRSPEKVDTSIENGTFSQDLRTVCYLKNGALYQKQLGKEKVKIADGVFQILAMFEDGRIYYTTTETVEKSYYDFVEDDLFSSDAAMKEPVYPTLSAAPQKPYRHEFQSEAAFRSAYEAYQKQYEAYQKEYWAYQSAVDQYYVDLTLWQERLEREDLRESLKKKSHTEKRCTVHCYDGKESVALTTQAVKEDSVVLSAKAEGSTLLWEMAGLFAPEKIKIGLLRDPSGVETALERAESEESRLYFLAVKETVTPMDLNPTDRVELDREGKNLYCLSAADENSEGTLYRIPIQRKKPGEKEVYDTGIFADYLTLIDGKTPLYYKNVTEEVGALFLDGALLAEKVKLYSFSYHRETGRLLFFVDWDGEKKSGRLVLWDGEITAVGENVSSAKFTQAGDLFYLTDWDEKKKKGELYGFCSGTSEKIDEGVFFVLTVYSNQS